MSTRRRTQLLRDYTARCRDVKPEVGPHGNYVRVHEHGGSEVDAYWRFRSDVVFLQALARTEQRSPGLYHRWSDGSPAVINLVAVCDADTIAEKELHEAMKSFVCAGAFRRHPRRSTTKLVKIGDVRR